MGMGASDGHTKTFRRVHIKNRGRDMSDIKEEANSVYVNSTGTLIEAARQEGYARGVEEGRRLAKDEVFAAERAAYREGQRDTIKKIITALGLEE